MVEGIGGNAVLSSEAAAEIVDRADGVPLFVEELTRAVLEAGGSGAVVEKTLAGALAPSASVPAALHAPLMARLDRLGRAPKEIAQIAAAIGREFSFELLAPVAGRREGELLDALGRLAEAGLVFHRGAPPHATYLFKHALVRDAAYGSLLRRRREELHARIATVLEADFPGEVAAEPELLAHHLTEARLVEKAVRWWLRAGERATERSANLEAIAHLKRGLQILERLPENQARDEQELLLQAALIVPFLANEGWASAAVERVASRAVELGGRIAADSPAQLQAVLARNYLAAVHMHRGEPRTGLAIAEAAFGLAEGLGDRLFLGQMHFRLGELGVHLGDLAGARRHFEKGLALYDPERDRAQAARLGYDVCIACHLFLAFVRWKQGFPDDGLRHAEEAIAAVRAAAHPSSEAFALSLVAYVHQLRGEVTLCQRLAEAALALASEQMLPFYATHASVLCGWALVRAGQLGEGLRRLSAGIDASRAMGARMLTLYPLPVLAEACLAAGRVEEGLSAVREALAETAKTGYRFYEGELDRLEAELVLASAEPITEGFDTADLKEAKALLDSLL
jgi:tetratricopeptide (TPR) repeat protein